MDKTRDAPPALSARVVSQVIEASGSRMSVLLSAAVELHGWSSRLRLPFGSRARRAGVLVVLGFLGTSCSERACAAQSSPRRLASGTNPAQQAAREGLNDRCNAGVGQLFPPASPWNTPIASVGVAADSATVVGFLQGAHVGRTRFQVDFSFEVLSTDGTAPRVLFQPTEDFYPVHCDPAPVPLPPGGALEGERDYRCTGDGDCHLLVTDWSQCRLWEMWRADVRNGTFRGGCLAIWDLRRLYPPQGRGRDCTSADAAGLPIVPLLFSADEIAAGQIRHALRFVLPNGLIRRNAYVAPASHNTPATRGSDAAPPYGARMRLKASANLEALKPAARVVARALQTYGMFLADGGRITFNAVADSRSVHQWNDVDFGAHDLKTLNWADFEMVDSGPVIRYRDQCSREPVAQ